MRRLSRFFGIICALATLFACAAASFAATARPALFTPEEQEYISSHKTLKVGYVPDRIPVSFKSKEGEFAGISRYILDRVGEISGFEFDYVELPTKDVTYDYLQGEGFALVTSVEYNEENKNARGILISEPYFSGRKVIVARNNFEFRYDADFTVAVSTGSQTLKKVLAKAFPNFRLQDYDNIPDCLNAVNSGEADLMIQNQYVVEYWLAKPKYEKLKVIPIMGLDDRQCFSAVVDFKGAGGPTQQDGEMLVNILDKSIACLSEDEIGSYTIQGVMENQYNYTFGDFLNRYRYSAVILVVSSIIIVILAIVLTRVYVRFARSRAEAQAKGLFLSAMSHEIRTPLNGLIGLNYLMERKLDDKPKMGDYLNQSTKTAKYLLTLVNDILDASGLVARKLELAENNVDMELLARTIFTVEGKAMEEKKLDFSMKTDFVSRYIKGDDVRIQQVILNLLDNSRKFTNEGGKVELMIKQEAVNKDKVKTTVTVSDTGRGMSEEFRKQVFNAFAQELETVSKGNQGTGLGLSVSRRLARLMGGDIFCQSEKGKGSVFTFTFSSDKASVPEEPLQKIAEIPEKRVLVAEDNELNGEIIVELLEDIGCKATLAVNGRVALEKFKSSDVGTYDVILMDLMMPELDGFETTREIRALERSDAKTVKIIACTANSFNDEKQRALDCGMNDFLSKPVDIAELQSKLIQ